MIDSSLRRRTILLLAVATFALLVGGEARAEEGHYPFWRYLQVTVELVEKYHVSRKKLDDDLAAVWQRKFVEMMDVRRFYFRQGDLDEFEPFARRLDEMTRAKDASFALLMRERLRERTAAAAKLAEELIDAEHDFAIEEETRDAAGYARDEPEQRERWRRRVKIELLAAKANGRSLADARRMLHKRYERVAREARELSDEELCGVYLKALCSAFDPHTLFLTRSDTEDFDIP